MNKEDYEAMLKDSLFWTIMVIVLMIFALVFSSKAVAVVLFSLFIGFVFALMVKAAIKMYKSSKYWHYQNKD